MANVDLVSQNSSLLDISTTIATSTTITIAKTMTATKAPQTQPRHVQLTLAIPNPLS